MTTALQRAAARRNIKKAIAANRRGGKKSHRSRRSSRGKSASPSHGEALGATYLNAKMGVQVLSPVTGSVLANVGNIPAQLKVDFGAGLGAGKLNGALALGEASAIGQRWADKKIGQAAALSRGSITAIAAELIPVAETVVDSKGKSAAWWHASYVRHTTGYNPDTGAFGFEQAVPYAGAKYGLGIARKLLNRAPIVATPLKQGLRMVGLTI